MKKDWKYLRGDIYYADLNPVCGSEQGGPRPVLVIQNNTGNIHSPTLIVASISTKVSKKMNFPTHYTISCNPAFAEPSVVMLEQIRTIDKKRILRYMGKISKQDMIGVENTLMISLELNPIKTIAAKYIATE